MSTSQLANAYFKQLEVGGFSSKDIEGVMRGNSAKIRSNIEIVQEAIRMRNLLLL